MLSSVMAEAGDALGIQASSQVWLDHLDLSSGGDYDKIKITPFALCCLH